MNLKIFCGFALVAAILTAGWQRSAISRTRAANDILRQQTAQSVAAPQSLQTHSDEIDALQEANRELPKLRNEVRRLRDEKREFETLQAENERLAAALKGAPKMVAPHMSEAQGFVLREKWAHAGFATPEATIQTFFWAIAQRDVKTWAECMSGSNREKIEQQLRESGDGMRKQFEREFAELAQIQGFRIAERKQIAEDKVELGLQAAAGGRLMPMPLRRLNGEWKLAD